MDKQKRDLMHQALAWRAIVDADCVSEDDQASFDRWMRADQTHRQAFSEAQVFWDGLASLSDESISHVGATQPRAVSTPGRVAGISRRFCLPIAAGIAAIACLLAWPLSVQETEIRPRYLATSTGEIKTEYLGDGSKITLGARSSISVLMTPERRAVEVLSGSAYFDVNKEPRPFEVASGRLLTKVTGTQFAVYRSGDTSQISVAEGSVSVSDAVNTADTRALVRGQHLAADARKGLGVVRRIVPEKIAAWRQDRLVYEEESLARLIDDLNRYREKPIELLDPSLLSKTITATFDTGELDLIIATLADVYSIEVLETPEKTLMRSER